MRFYCIACEALARMIYQAAANSAQTVDIRLFSLGKHNDPSQLNQLIQAEIDQVDERKYDAILIGYGLCGNWLKGLTTRSLPVILPKVHDCIPMFLGDPDLYKQKMEQEPGTYWYTRDFIERAEPGDSFIPLGASSNKIFGSTLQELIAKYGEDNAQYLADLAGDWQKNYKRAIWVAPVNEEHSEQEEKASFEAASRGWSFEHLRENPVLVHALINGLWKDSRSLPFFHVPPHTRVSLSFDEQFFLLEPQEKVQP